VGNVVSLAEHRRNRAARGGADVAGAKGPRVTFYFDLGSPLTYLAAERVDRLFGGVIWRPVLEEAMQPEAVDPALVEDRARALGLPLVWPDLQPDSVRPAMRVAALAAERGRAATFVLAATRLAFCGGFELDHPEVLAEAAAAADLGLEDCLKAAGDVARDGQMEEGARKLLAQGADALPVLRVGRTIFPGEHRISEASAAAVPAVGRRQAG
jgi:2-hydroxychromene-2-carboxylate isomerase